MDKIGEIVVLKGSATAATGGEVRELSIGSPVYQEDVLTTAAHSNVEIRFADDTVLSQGPESTFTIDGYVFDPQDGEASEMLLRLATGTFRMVTGQIAAQNPENVNVQSPLATIGIRGTTTIHRINSDGTEKHGAESLTGRHVLVLSDQYGNTQFVNYSTGGSDFAPGAPMTPVRSFSPGEIQEIRHIVPLTTLGERPADDQGQDQDQDQDQDRGRGDNGDEDRGDDGGDEGNPEGGEGEDGEGGDEGEGGEADGEGEELQAEPEPGEEQPDAQADNADQGQGTAPNSAPQTPINAPGENLGQNDPFSPPQVFGPEPQNPLQGPQVVPKPLVVPPPVVQVVQPPVVEIVVTDDDPTPEPEPETPEIDAPRNPSDRFVNIIKGTNGAETLNGTNQMDAIFGFSGNDVIYGGPGEDYIDGGPGDDYINGYLNGQSSPTDNWGEPEEDIVSYWSATGSVDVNLENGMAHGAAGTDTLVNIYNVIGSHYCDVLIGHNNENDWFEGGRGDDYIDGASERNGASYMFATGSVYVDLLAGTATGADGNDTLLHITSVEGSDYNDTLLGNNNADVQDNFDPGKGNDYIDGRAGENRVEYENADSRVVVDLAAGTADGQGHDILVNIDQVGGTAYNDSLFGDSDFNVLQGEKGDDYLDGRGGTDQASYSGADGAVTVDLTTGSATGADGHDTLVNIENVHGSEYNDSLFGDSGDNLFVGWAGDDYIDGRGGVDTVAYWHTQSAVTVNLSTGGTSGGAGVDTLLNVEGVYGSGYNDMITGNGLDNMLNGQDGNDVLVGQDGNDVLYGSNGDDLLKGETGDDILYGDDGNDTLFGGLGTDQLTGGAGYDLFYYESTNDGSTTGDYVYDFNHAADTFVFNQGNFNNTATFVTMAGYNGTNSGAGATPVFVYDTSTDTLHYDSDGDSGAVSVAIAQFDNNPDDFDASDIAFSPAI